MRLAVIDLPIEALLTLALGKELRQYYVPWMPGLLICAAVALAAAPAARLPRASGGARTRIRLALWGIFGLLGGLFVWLWSTSSSLEAYRSPRCTHLLPSITARLSVSASTTGSSIVMARAARTSVENP